MSVFSSFTFSTYFASIANAVKRPFKETHLLPIFKIYIWRIWDSWLMISLSRIFRTWNPQRFTMNMFIEWSHNLKAKAAEKSQRNSITPWNQKFCPLNAQLSKLHLSTLVSNWIIRMTSLQNCIMTKGSRAIVNEIIRNVCLLHRCQSLCSYVCHWQGHDSWFHYSRRLDLDFAPIVANSMKIFYDLPWMYNRPSTNQ